MAFYKRYKDAYHLPNPKPLASPFEAPCKPLRSQEQEQDQEQDKRKTARVGAGSRARGKSKGETQNGDPLPFTITQAMDALRPAGGVIVDPFPKEKKYTANLTRLIRSYPDLEKWTLVSEWLAHNGDGYAGGWRGGKPDLAVLIKSFGAWVQQSADWAKNGKGEVNGNGNKGRRSTPSVMHPKTQAKLDELFGG
jgi:hypothetical protein